MTIRKCDVYLKQQALEALLKKHNVKVETVRMQDFPIISVEYDLLIEPCAEGMLPTEIEAWEVNHKELLAKELSDLFETEVLVETKNTLALHKNKKSISTYNLSLQEVINIGRTQYETVHPLQKEIEDSGLLEINFYAQDFSVAELSLEQQRVLKKIGSQYFELNPYLSYARDNICSLFSKEAKSIVDYAKQWHPHIAAANNYIEIMRVLLDIGLSPDFIAVDPAGPSVFGSSSAMSVAPSTPVDGEESEEADRGINPNSRDELYEITLLTKAAFSRHVEMVKLLLEKGALALALNGNGQTALQFFLENLGDGQDSEIGKLLSAAEVKERQAHGKVAAAAPSFFAPEASAAIMTLNIALVQYAKVGNLAKVKECIDGGADVNAKYGNSTALLNAITEKHIDVVYYLLTLPDIDINLTDDYLNESPLIRAVFGHLPDKVVDLLLGKDNIDLHIQGYLTGTALTYAIFSEQYDVAKKLLAKERVFHNQEHPGALNYAIMRESPEMIALLVEKGADVNMPGYEGTQDIPDEVWQMNPDEYTYPAACREAFTTPLCCAVGCNVRNMVKFLLEKYNAKPDVITANKETALLVAARFGYTEIFNLLINNGANLQLQIDGITLESIIRGDHLVPYEIKKLLPPLPVIPPASAALPCSAYLSPRAVIDEQSLEAELASLQKHLQRIAQEGQVKSFRTERLEAQIAVVVSSLLGILPPEKSEECLEQFATQSRFLQTV